jgi:long-chain acyl-CoA synthetase
VNLINIFPEPIEYILNAHKYISQSMVYGDKQKALSAIIVPNKESLQTWCEKANIEFKLPEVLSNTSVVNLYRQAIDDSLKDFSKTEGISNFKLIEEEFSIDNALLTITMKLRRHHILRKYLI